MSNYYSKRDAKVNIAHELMSRGWKVFGYKADESDSMTDYYSPAHWDGIASKNGFILVVDNKTNSYSGKIQTKRTTTGSNNYKKIDKLSNMTIENGCTEAEAQAAKDMINKLKASANSKEEITSIWPEFTANTKGSIWHIEKDGAVIAKGRALTIFSSVPDSYMFDINEMEFKGSYKNIRRYNGNIGDWETVERTLNEAEEKAVKSFKEFLNKIESVTAIKIGEEEESDKLIKVTEEKKTIKTESVVIDRKESLKVGDIVHVDNSTGYVKITEVEDDIYYSIKVSGRTWKESKSKFPNVTLNRKSFDGSLQRGYLKVYNIVEVEHVETIEKWIKAKTTKKPATKPVKQETKKETIEKDILIDDSLETEIITECNNVEVKEVENTTRLYFTDKPNKETIQSIKNLGFRFYRNDGLYWGIYTSKLNKEELNNILNITAATETIENISIEVLEEVKEVVTEIPINNKLCRDYTKEELIKLCLENDIKENYNNLSKEELFYKIWLWINEGDETREHKKEIEEVQEVQKTALNITLEDLTSDISNYNISQDIIKKENENSFFRSKDIDHNKNLHSTLNQACQEVWELLESNTNSLNIDSLLNALDRFKRDYTNATIKYLNHKGNNPSWMVTGRAGRNARKDEKMNNRQMSLNLEITATVEKFNNYINKAKKKIKNDIYQHQIQELKKGLDSVKSVPTFKRVKEEVKTNLGSYNKFKYVYKEYIILKDWGAWRVYDNKGSELYTSKTAGTLEECKKWVAWQIEINNKNIEVEKVETVEEVAEVQEVQEQQQQETKEVILKVIENTLESIQDTTNATKCNNLYLEVEALERRLKLINSSKLKYKLEEKINTIMREIAIIISSDPILYNQFLQESKE